MYLERYLKSKSRLHVDKLKEKTKILFIYDKDCTNETEKSDCPNYLLQTSIQFLEDYVRKDYLEEKEKEYGK